MTGVKQLPPHAQEPLQREIALLVGGSAVRELELFPGVRVLGTHGEEFGQFARVQHAVLVEVVTAEQIGQKAVALRGNLRSFSLALSYFNSAWSTLVREITTHTYIYQRSQ